MTKARVKICGLSTPDSLRVACEAYCFFEKSPRNVSIEKARDLAIDLPPGV